MKNSFLSLLIILIVSSCSTDDNEPKDYSSYYFAPKSKITVTNENNYSFANIEYGENLVFRFKFTKADNPNIADDEYSERLIFEIDPTVTEFTYNAEEIMQTNAYFNQYCFCSDVGSIPINSGTINGTKIGRDDWLININISFNINGEQQTRQINEVFSNIEIFRQSY